MKAISFFNKNNLIFNIRVIYDYYLLSGYLGKKKPKKKEERKNFMPFLVRLCKPWAKPVQNNVLTAIIFFWGVGLGKEFIGHTNPFILFLFSQY